ncbi:MAG: (d)CMP kinase [Gammaproteobacteria bacterium]|nr:(d)CMP kinase [Gammaproteobacteria bacterium]NIN61415.1 (d)CMP kinase [Gammaproteobacteria bacterium]NIO61182.1 (d)CMP kinase [Gammaproteobacteria bacterium]NIP48884.1 (d)CMP kinase [Gammaproteobacteria bacterium]NIQ09338.1 (d)CMP kinase [Gammaproteobacteria bacterium]
MTDHVPVIAVDGPSGTGKGTICRYLANTLKWHLLDSGALYRLLALAAGQQGVELDDAEALAELAANLEISFDYSGDIDRVLLAGQDVSDEIRTESCANAASRLAALPEVRQALLSFQQRFRQSPGLVADGRDMGTIVFPDADLKIFLTADAAERARRRHKQLKEKGFDVNLADLSVEITERDARDSQRAVSPLIPANDARVIDTTDLSIQDVVELVSGLIRDQFPV